MITIRQRQKICECHDYELTPEQYKEYRKIPFEDRPNFLDRIGGTPAEYENEDYENEDKDTFSYEVIKK
jgi:hypothetical protein